MSDSIRIKAHQFGTSRIGGNRIVREDKTTKGPRRSVKGAISFHRENCVRDHKVNRYRRAYIENALLNSSPVKDILRPAVLAPRNNTKHILHAEGDARPVMRLYLGHRDKEISFKNGPRQVQMREIGIAGTKGRTHQFVAIQVYEADLPFPEALVIAALEQHQLCVTLMPRSFGNHNPSCSEAPEALRSRHYQQR